MKKVDISRSTYEKSLRELKKEGLITFQRSKKSKVAGKFS